MDNEAGDRQKVYFQRFSPKKKFHKTLFSLPSEKKKSEKCCDEEKPSPQRLVKSHLEMVIEERQ